MRREGMRLSDQSTGSGSQIRNGIFVCYRHKDSSWQAQMLAESLRTRFGRERVFMDVDRVKMGNWRNQINDALATSAVIVVLIGPEWIDELNDRLQAKDEVRYEITEAIRLGIQMVPVTLERTEVPDKTGLPDDIAALVDEEAYPLFGGKGWQPPGDILLDDLSEVVQAYKTAVPTENQEVVAAVPTESQQVVDPTIPKLPEKRKGRAKRSLFKPKLAQSRSAKVHFDRADQRRDQGDLDGALADYSESIRLDPKYPFSYNGRAGVRRDQGDLDGALADYNEAIRLWPSFFVFYGSRGDCRKDQGDLDGALADYNEIIRLNPKLGFGYFKRAFCRRDLGDLVGALADLDEAIRLDPEYATKAQDAQAEIRKELS